MNLISNKDLYDLVKSLTKSEKRFLKLNAGANNFSEHLIEFFNTLEKEPNFVAELFGKKNDSEELYSFILKSLRLFYAENNASFVIKDEITNILNLFDKAQYKQCRKILNKQKQEAYLYERFHFVLELLSLEKQLISIETQFNVTQNTLESVVKEEEEIIKKAKNLGEYTLLFSRINLNTRQKNKAKTQEDLDTISSLLNSPLLKNDNLLLSSKARIIYYHCRSILFCRCQDNQSREEECEHLLHLMDKEPALIAEMPNRYITTLNNLVNIAFEERKFKTCLMRIEQLQIKSDKKLFNTTDLQLKSTISVLNAKLSLFTNTGKKKEAEAVVKDIESLLTSFKEKISNEDEVIFDYNIAIMHIYFADYKKALVYITRVLSQGNKKLREDLQSFARILNIGLNYELNNLNQISYIILTLKQNLKTQVSHFKTEILILTYFEKLANLKLNKSDSEIEIFQSFQKDLIEVMKDPHEHNVNYYFEIELYVQSKLTGVSMQKLVSEKYKQASLL